MHIENLDYIPIQQTTAPLGITSVQLAQQMVPQWDYTDYQIIIHQSIYTVQNLVWKYYLYTQASPPPQYTSIITDYIQLNMQPT